METIDIYNHPDFFYCTKLRCWLLKLRCLEYQAEAERVGTFVIGSNNSAMGQARLLTCADCGQGQEIARETGNTGKQEVKNMSVIERSKEVKQGVVVPLCAECGVNPVIVSKKTGKPIRDKCSQCCSDIAMERRRRKKKPDELLDGATPQPAVTNPGPIQIEPPTEPVNHKMCIIALDLSEYPDIKDYVEKRAKDNMRTVEAQVLWDLKKKAEAVTGFLIVDTGQSEE